MQEHNHKHIRTCADVCTPLYTHTRILARHPWPLTNNHIYTWWVVMQQYHKTKTITASTSCLQIKPYNWGLTFTCTTCIQLKHHKVHSIPHLLRWLLPYHLPIAWCCYIQASTTLDTNKKYNSDKVVTATLLYLTQRWETLHTFGDI